MYTRVIITATCLKGQIEAESRTKLIKFQTKIFKINLEADDLHVTNVNYFKQGKRKKCADLEQNETELEPK